MVDRKRPTGQTLEEAFGHYAPAGLPADECWLWLASLHPFGYGQLMFEQRRIYAHRVAWQIANGRPPGSREVVRHTCDNPPCVNPNHLKIGTHRQNMHDMIERGRAVHPVRLSVDDVAAIRAARARGMAPALADKYGVSVSAIFKIWQGIRR